MQKRISVIFSTVIAHCRATAPAVMLTLNVWESPEHYFLHDGAGNGWAKKLYNCYYLEHATPPPPVHHHQYTTTMVS